MKFKFLEHTADIKFQAFGKNLGDVFKNSALAISKAMSNEKIKPNIKKEIKISGKDLENLLYNFLEEIIFLIDSEDFFISQIKKIKINKKKLTLTAETFGDNIGKYEIKIDVKAITYNEMFIKKIKNNWVAQVVLDV